jgi:hypothetical protein
VQNDVAEATATGSFCRLGPGPCDPDVTSLCQASTRRCTPATRMEARRKTSSHSGMHARHTWNIRWFLVLRTMSSFLFFLFSSYRKREPLLFLRILPLLLADLSRVHPHVRNPRHRERAIPGPRPPSARSPQVGARAHVSRNKRHA